jgi:hypothetical protein
MMSKLLVYLLLLASIASAFAGRADANDGEFGGRSLGVYPRVMGNELEQYFRFESMTKSMNTEEVFDLWEACIVAVSIDYRRFGCTAEVRTKIRHLVDGWPRVFTDTPLRMGSEPDCGYQILPLAAEGEGEKEGRVEVQAEVGKERESFSFKIAQTDCRSHEKYVT